MKNKKLAVLLAVMMIFAVALASCSQTEYQDSLEDEGTDRINAIESSYQVLETSETYAEVEYKFPYIEGMTNMSKQARINGTAKRLATATSKDNDGGRGKISDSYEVMVANDELFSIIFPTDLNADIATRTLTMVIKAGPEGTFVNTIENLFGKPADAEGFTAARAVLTAAGADSSMADVDFAKIPIYFEGEDMKALILHLVYFTDKGYDISVPFEDVIEYLIDAKAEMFGFAQ